MPALRAAEGEPIRQDAAAVSTLEDELRGRTRFRLQEAGVERPVEVSVSGSNGRMGPGTTEVVVGGRPAAVRAVAEVTSVSALVDEALVRRRHLLAEGLPAFASTPAAGPGPLGAVPAVVAAMVLESGGTLAGAQSQLGGPLDPTQPAAAPTSSLERAEELIEASYPASLTLVVADSVLRTGTGREPLDQARTDLHHRTGIVLPDVSLERGGAADLELGMVVNRVLLSAQLGPASSWGEVVDRLRRTVEANADCMIRIRDVRESRARYALQLPDLAEVADRWSDALLTAVVRALALNGDSIRNGPRIMLALEEAIGGPPSKEVDPHYYASCVRRRFNEDLWYAGHRTRLAGAMTLPRTLEEKLVSPLHPSGPTSGEIAGVEWEVLRRLARHPQTTVVVTRDPGSIWPVRRVLRALPGRRRVIAAQELDPDVELPADR